MMNTHKLSTKNLLCLVTGAVFCVSFSFTSIAQEDSGVSVLNGGFEQNSGLPYESGMWELMTHWSNTGSESANPDYYHLDGVAGGDLPETPMAMIDSRSGRAMAGLEVSRREGTNKESTLLELFQSL